MMAIAAGCAFDARPALRPADVSSSMPLLLQLRGGFAQPGLSGAATRATLSSAKNILGGASAVRFSLGLAILACLVLFSKVLRAWLSFYMTGKSSMAASSSYDPASEPPPWGRLAQLLADAEAAAAEGVGLSVVGAASGHPSVAREEAARKLISNHHRVLADITNAFPLTQYDLERLPVAARHYADQALRETARRLVGFRVIDEADDGLPTSAQPSTPAQAAAWKGACAYLDGRIQAAREECPGRSPDMSEGAAAAMRSVLREVGVGLTAGAGRGVAVAP